MLEKHSRKRKPKSSSLFLSDMSGAPENSNLGQCLNPAFVHSMAVPHTDKILGASYKICAVARGDGIVDVINLESELRPLTKSRSKNGEGRSANCHESGEKRIHLDYSSGGHTAAVSCVYVSVEDCHFTYYLHFLTSLPRLISLFNLKPYFITENCVSN